MSYIVSSIKGPMLEKYAPQVYSITFQRRPLGLSPVITVFTQAQGGLTPWALYDAAPCPHLSGCLALVEPSSHKCHTAAVRIGPCHEQSFAVKVPGAVVRRSSQSVSGMMTPLGLGMGKLLESGHQSGSVGTPPWWWSGTEGLVRWDWRSVGR